MLVDIVNEQSQSEDVTLIVGNAAVDEALAAHINPRVNLFFLRRPPGSRNPWYLWKLYRMLKSIEPDVIHSHLDSFIRLLTYLPQPRVLTVHNTGIKLNPKVGCFDAVYCISEAVRCDLAERYPSISLTVVNNGIRFSKIPTKRDYRQEPFHIVHVSRLEHKQKGQDVLLYAIRELKQSVQSGQLMVDFIGDGPSRDYLETLSEKLDLQDSCRFLGARPRNYIYDNLHRYDLLVQPSRFEGFGLTVIEGMAAGLPVLVSDVEGPLEIIGHGRYGYYFRSEDVSDCVKQILAIISRCTTRDFADERNLAHRYARDKYDVANTAKEYLKNYSRVIERQGDNEGKGRRGRRRVQIQKLPL